MSKVCSLAMLLAMRATSSSVSTSAMWSARGFDLAQLPDGPERSVRWRAGEPFGSKPAEMVEVE